MGYFDDYLERMRQEREARQRKEAADRKLMLRFKEAMALAASKALVKAGDGNFAIALTWVEEAVEEAALELGLQQIVHQERGEEPITYSRRRKHPRLHQHLLLSGRVGMRLDGRTYFWPASYRTRRFWARKRRRS